MALQAKQQQAQTMPTKPNAAPVAASLTVHARPAMSTAPPIPMHSPPPPAALPSAHSFKSAAPAPIGVAAAAIPAQIRGVALAPPPSAAAEVAAPLAATAAAAIAPSKTSTPPPAPPPQVSASAGTPAKPAQANGTASAPASATAASATAASSSSSSPSYACSSDQLQVACTELLESLALVEDIDGAPPYASEPAPVTRSKHLLARAMQVLSGAPIDHISQQILLLVRSLALSELEGGTIWSLIEPSSTVLFPFFFSFLHLLARAECAEAPQWWFAKETMGNLETFLRLLHSRPEEQRASRAARRDLEDMLAELLPKHTAFAEAAVEGEAAFESHRSPYHTEANATADASASASTPASSAFVPFSLQAWRRLRQHAACQCCRRMRMQEQTHWTSAAQKAAGWSVPACKCSSQGEAESSCSCPTALRLLQSKQSPSLAAHPLVPFFSLDLHHHSAPMSVRITSPQQLLFFTEKMLQLFSWCVETRIGEDEGAAAASFTDQRALLTMAFGYAAIPDASLRSLGVQLLTQLLQHQMIAATSAPLQAHLLAILLDLLQARVRRGARIQAREEDESSARFRPQHVQQATKEAQMAEDQRLQSMMQLMMIHLPLPFLQPHATAIVQACSGCMASTWSLPLLHALLSVSLGLIRAYPSQTVHLISQLFPAALVHLQRVHNDAGSMLVLPVEISSFLAQLASEHVFPFVSLASIWSHRFFSPLESVPVQSALVQHQRRLDEFKDMPQLEGPAQQSQSSTSARKNRAHGLPSEGATTPSKRARKGANVSPPRSGGSAAGHTPTKSELSSSLTSIPDPLLSSLPALLSLTPEQESMLFTLQPLLHQQLHRALPDAPLQFATMQPVQILAALMELEITVSIVVPQLAADSVGADQLHAHLVAQIGSWLQWIEGTLARAGSSSADPQPTVAASPAIVRRFLAILQFCADRLSSRLNVTRLCSSILRPASTEFPSSSSSSSSPALPLSLSIAALQLLCSMPDRDLDLFLLALQSSEVTIKCAAILLLPPFLAGLSSAQKKARAPQLLHMLAQMITAPGSSASASALVAHKHVLDALAGSIGSIVCALSSSDASPPAAPHRAWRSPFIRLRADDALFLSEDHTSVAVAATSPDCLSCTLDAGGEGDVETAAKLLSAPPPTPSQIEEMSEGQSSLESKENVQLVAPLRRMLQPMVRRFQCPCCDGTRSAASRDNAKVIGLKDLLPFFALLDPSQAVPTRLRMLRGCFRLLRHVPPHHFVHRPPKGGSAAALLSSASLSIPLSPPAKSRIASSPPRSKTKAVSAHEGFSLSQATGGSGKKINPRLSGQQQAQSSLPASLSMDPSPPRGGSGSQQMMDLDDGGGDAGGGPSGVEDSVVLHPLALYLLFLLFDAHESVRRCFVHQLQGWMDDDAKDGPFLALFNQPGGSPSQATSLRTSPSFALFHSALVLVQSNWHLLPEWQAEVKRALQSLSTASAAPVQGVELSPAPGADQVQDAACFHPSYLLTSYAALGEVCLFIPLDSESQHVLLWQLVDALSHALTWESHEVHAMRSSWKQLRALMLHCFTRVAHRHHLSTSALFFLHSQYLFKQIFNPLNPSHPHLLRVLFDHLILRDGPSGPVIGEGMRPMDFFSEGVRMLLPTMMVDEFKEYCEPDGAGAGTLQFLADLCTDDHSCRSMVLNHLDLILAHLLRSPTHHSMAFVYQKLQPYLGRTMHSQSHNFFSLIGLVHATLVFELIWRIGGGGAQRDQAMQALGWMMDVMKDSNKAQGSVNSSVKNMLQKAGSAAAGSIQLAPQSAQQAFMLTAPTPSAAQLADYLQPNFLGTFTKLNSLLTTTFPSSSRHAAPLHIPNAYKIHALHVLAALLTLSKERLKGFIPKILASMQQLNAQAFRDATLASSLPSNNDAASVPSPPPPPLPFHLLCLWSIFIDTLVASGQMGEYLSTIVVTLVHTLCRLAEQQGKAAEAAAAAAARSADSSAAMDVDEHKSASSHSAAAASSSVTPTMLFSMKDFTDYCSPLPTPRPPRSSNTVDVFYVWISSLPESMLEHALVPHALESPAAPPVATSSAAAVAPPLTAASFRSHCIAHLLSILRDLLLSPKIKNLSSLLKTIPPLPSHPLLQPINEVLQNEFDAELKHRLSKISKINPEPTQQGTAGSAASSSARKQAQRTAETLANASSLFLRVERLLTTMVHEFAQVRTYSLKSLCALLGDPSQRTAWDAFCSSEASAGAEGSNERMHERVSQLVTALLQRCSDAKVENRQLASECLGEIGAIEPSQLSVGIHIKPPQYSFDHAEHYRTVYLSQYLIQNVLVRSLRGATDVATQDGMLCAIQELLKYCGIDEPVQQVAQNHSQALGSATKPPQPSAASRNALDDLMSLVLKKRTTPLLPHATLTEAQQLAQQYQAAQLWLGFNSDVRDVIQACLSSKFRIEDVYLRPQQPPAQTLGFRRDEKASEDLAALAGKKGSARKRKETSAAAPTAMELEDSGEAVGGKKKTTPERERKKHGAAASGATSTAAATAPSSESAPVSFLPASAGLTSANIIPLPSVPCFRPKQQTTLLQWLGQFTRYLIAYTALPPVHMGEISPAHATSASPSAISETLLYQACIGVVQSDISTGLFLLPYLVDHALRYGSDALRDFIKREIMAVLTACNQQHGSSSSNVLQDAAAVSLPLSLSSSSSSSSSATQLCIQSVFELLDTLNAWWLRERRSNDLAKNASPGSASGSMPSALSGTVNDSARPGQLPLSYGSSGAAAQAQVVVPSMPLPASRSLESRKLFLDSIPKKALAAAAFHCKAYTRALKYQELYLREEKDKWHAESNKRMAAAQAAPNQKKGRVTQTSAAAAAAEASSTPSSTAQSELISVGMGAGLQTSDLDACQSMYGALEEPDGMRGLSSLRQKLSLQSEVRDLESVGLWSQALVLYEKAMQLHSEQTHLHTGLMECYRNLGQWEAGLTHAKGLLNDPALPTADQKQIAIYGVQYAWRLRDWSMVQQLLDSKEHAPDSVQFEVRLAALLLALHKGDKETYVSELRRARSCVLSPLSAASWESYERAYPYLLQLQMIQEVEQMRAAMIKAEEAGGARRSTLTDVASQASVLPGSPVALLSSSLSNASAFAPLTPAGGAFRESLHQLGLAWLPRLRRTPMTFRIREHLLSLRRVLYSEFHLNGDAGFGWWRLAELARDTSQLDVAQGALLHAQELGVQHLFIERAKLLRARGGRFEHDALMYLEREFGVLRDTSAPTVSSQTTLEATFTQAPVHLKPLLATTSVLLGQWVQESSAKESNHVFKLYNQAIWMSPRMEAPHFFMGKLYDELLTAEINKGKAAARDDDRMRGTSGSSVASKSKHSYSVGGASPDVAGKFLHAILKCYGSALTHGNRFLFQALPRMLTLWFEHSEHWSGTVSASSQLKASVGSAAHSSQSERSGGGIPGLGSGRGSAGTPQTLEEKFSQCHTLMTDLVKTLAPFQWLTAFPQIISRLTHSNKQVYALIKEIIVAVFADYPQQAIWLLAVITRSLDAERLSVRATECSACCGVCVSLSLCSSFASAVLSVHRKRSKDIMGAVHRSATHSPEMLDKSSQLFDLLFRLCTTEPKKPPRGNPPSTLSLARDLPALAAMKHLPLIVPTQAQLTVALPPPPLEFTAAHADAFVETAALSGAGAQNVPHRTQKLHRAFPSTQVMIVGFQDHVDILKSKERPKKVTFLGSDGKVYAFLAKREVKGDMRKNSRMMEFVSVVNRLLRDYPDARSRQLQCRSFSVLPMTEECGIIEWVPNTTGLRHLVKATHDEEGIVTNFMIIKQMYEEHAPKKSDAPPDVENEIRLYHRLCEMFRPVFHKCPKKAERNSSHHTHAGVPLILTVAIVFALCVLSFRVSHTIPRAKRLVPGETQVRAVS